MTVYIYALYCPTTGEPRYIGKTNKPESRLAGHIYKANGHHTTHHCANWIRQLLKEGRRPILRPIFEVPAGEAWQPHEKRLIAEYRDAGYPLTNLTGGGDGFFGMSAESLARKGRARSAQLAIPEVKEKWRQALLLWHGTPAARLARKRATENAWHDPEKRAAFMAGMNTPEAKVRRSEASRKRYEDPAVLAAHSSRLKVIWSTPERREEARLRSIKAWADPVVTEARLVNQRVAMATPEYKAKISKAARAANARPEVQAARSKACTAAWTDPAYRAAILGALKSPQFIAAQSERLSTRWGHEDGRRELIAVRWPAEQRAAQAARLAEPERAAKIKAKLSDPELIKRRNAAIKAAWARRKAETA